MTLIPEDKIAEVRERTDIVQLISGFVTLRKQGGGNWKGLCPFHDERSPSFNVNQQRQIYHCFGCQQTGDVIKFLMDLERRDFIDVVRDLAQRAGVELPEPDPAFAREQKQRDSERERLLRLLEYACKLFEAELEGAAGAPARDYLDSRGISPAIRKRFRLGYAPESWDFLWERLAKKGVTPAEAREAGLCSISERSGKPFDFFRGRVMLPVIDRSGHVIAFGSRLLDPQAKDRKYVNSPDSPVFHKKDNLYGLHAARDAIRKGGRAVLVEGNFDVLSLHEAGIEEAVAPMGTALTAEQLGLLGRFARQLVVVFDGDDAGRAAAQKATRLFARTTLDVRVAALVDPDKKKTDPDEFVRQRGADEFRALCASAQPALERYLDVVAAAAEPTVPGRMAAIHEARDVLFDVRDAATRDLYIGHFAGKLGVSAATIMKALSSSPQKPPREAAPDPVPAPAPRKLNSDELELLRQLSRAGSAENRPPITPAELAELVEDPDLLRLVLGALEGRPVPELLAGAPDEVRSACADALVADPTRDDLAARRVLEEALDRLRIRLKDKRIDAVSRALRASAGQPEAFITEQLRELSRLKSERQELKEKRRSPR